MHIDEVLTLIPHAAELQAARTAMQGPAWLVGGVVRDLLLGRTPADVDIAAQHPEPLARRFAGMVNGRLVPMDPENGIWRVALGPRQFFDFCRFRDHDIVGDLRGRDFTINAIALRLPEHDRPGGLMDPFHGLDDLNTGRLRMVHYTAFRNDPARILRAFRFMAELHLTIDEDTWSALCAEADRLPLVAPERVLAEWWKLCTAAHAAAAIQRMDEARVLDVLFPELRAAKGVTQNIYHHLDVWEHLLLATTYMARFLRHPDEVFGELAGAFSPVTGDDHRRARLVMLALLHDVGKPGTRSVKQGKVHFYGHEVLGAQQMGSICQRLRVSREDTRAMTTIMRQHMRPLFLMHAMKNGELSRKAMMKFFDDTGPYALDVMALAMADKSAGQGPAAEPDVQERLRALYRTLLNFHQSVYQPAQAQPLLTGRDLTQELHLMPGPAVGALLTRARELQVQGKLGSHDEALQWAAEQTEQ